MPDDRIGARRNPARSSGRVPFVWVEDDDTKHRYDVPENAIRPGMTPVEGYELNYSSKARAPKFFVDKAGEVPAPVVDEPSGDAVAARAATSAAAASKAVKP